LEKSPAEATRRATGRRETVLAAVPVTCLTAHGTTMTGHTSFSPRRAANDAGRPGARVWRGAIAVVAVGLFATGCAQGIDRLLAAGRIQAAEERCADSVRSADQAECWRRIGDWSFEQPASEGYERAVRYYQRAGVPDNDGRMRAAQYMVAIQAASTDDVEAAEVRLKALGYTPEVAEAVIARECERHSFSQQRCAIKSVEYLDRAWHDSKRAKTVVGVALLRAGIKNRDSTTENRGARLLAEAGQDVEHLRSILRADRESPGFADATLLADDAEKTALECRPLFDAWRAANCPEGVAVPATTGRGADPATSRLLDCLTRATEKLHEASARFRRGGRAAEAGAASSRAVEIADRYAKVIARSCSDK
jgi:hypothetical protein